MFSTLRIPRSLPLLAALMLALGCTSERVANEDDTGVGGDDPVDEEEGCPVEDTYYADHCAETYCGLPELEVGTGFDQFIGLEDGDDIAIVRGSQGGYHMDLSARMSRLCPIVYLRASVWLDPGDGGDLQEIADVDRHVQAVRMEAQTSSVQEFWGVRAFVPCEHWPDTNLTCSGGAGRDGHLEDFEVVVRLEAEDHTGRIANHERRLQPVCCEG